MWTSTMDLDQKKVLLAQMIGRFYRNIYFSSYSPLQVQNAPRQSLPENSWVRVRNRLSGICGSDLHLLYHGGRDQRVASAATPSQSHYYPGHEVVGEVIEIGDDVQRLQVGDRVALQWKPNCVTAGVQPPCHSCARGNYNLCEQGTFLAPPPLGGGWSEEMLLHEQQLFRVPSSLTDEQAVMLEPTAMAIHAVLRHLPQPGDKVLIIGAGTVGLLIQQIVRALTPQTEISVLARYPFQVERATRLGAAHIIYPHDAYVGIQRATQAKLYNGLFGNRTLQGGYDVIYDTIGQKNGPLERSTLHHALRWIRSQGTIVVVGLRMQPIGIDLTPLWTQEINLQGSNAHGMEEWPLGSEHEVSTFKVASELMIQGSIAPEQLITHHFAVNNYKHALLTASDKAESRAIKVVFDYSLLPASVVPNVRASAPRIRRQSTINFMEEYPETGELLTGERPRTRSGALAQTIDPARRSSSQPLTPANRKEIPSAQPHTKELAKSARTAQVSQQYHNNNDDDGTGDTASALPAVGRRATGNHHSYVPQSHMSGNIDVSRLKGDEKGSVPATSNHIEDEAKADQIEHTQYFVKPQAIPQTENDLDLNSDATVRVSRSEVAAALSAAKLNSHTAENAAAASETPVEIEQEVSDKKADYTARIGAQELEEPEFTQNNEQTQWDATERDAIDPVENYDPFWEEQLYQQDIPEDSFQEEYAEVSLGDEYDPTPSLTPVESETIPEVDALSSSEQEARPRTIAIQQARSRNRKKRSGGR
ncbi:zinc-dependent alcohol dehydrogenase [Dictyobacter arantiisoli]|uniref:Enoyl reductase (ER) domain-containing protein n=1 Tax=Dictyobacter arantiisoli TaxID=2014874 RepID=A0A5A5TCE4_9CHLR|nr:alcohol dehydrogenase catalytic domain-containing protein [Dictyobacter arantiisoli]GCF09007.1 hypothetical protein KDI_25710 [Dictyobacter arantiisoli]